MTTKVSKWGNSYGVRLPKQIKDHLNLKDGSSVEIEIADGKIIIVPKEKEVLTLDDLISGMTMEGVLDQFEDYDDEGNETVEI